VDSRHSFTTLDRQLLEFVAPRVGSGEVKLLVLLTKSDKLSRNELAKAISAAGQVLGEVATDAADISLVPFSALSRMGVEDAALVLHGWVTGAAPMAEGDDAAAAAVDPADPADAGKPAEPAEPAA